VDPHSDIYSILKVNIGKFIRDKQNSSAKFIDNPSGPKSKYTTNNISDRKIIRSNEVNPNNKSSQQHLPTANGT
jgi:hypothetical protein